MMETKKIIFELRTKHGLSQDELAKKLDYWNKRSEHDKKISKDEKEYN